MRTSRAGLLVLTAIAATVLPPTLPQAQSTRERLPREAFDVIPPADRIEGKRGSFRIAQPGCRVGPLGPHTRRRIVDIAVQEWAVFGFQTLDQVTVERRLVPAADGLRVLPDALNPDTGRERLARRTLRLGQWEDDGAVLATVAGYWSATPDGAEVIRKQNAAWNSDFGDTIGWLEPWSAAFISWTMCEAGLGERETFRRSIAHWEYVDQAIEERATPGRAAYEAYDLGERDIVPGDLLCSARGQATYRTIAERRPDLGRYAPLHCDVVVKTDAAQGAIFVIGGNVLNSVSLAALRASMVDGRLRPVSDQDVGGARRWFAHLSLKTGPVEADALDHSPTVRSFSPSP